MAEDVEELFVRSVDVGVANLDMAIEDEVVHAKAVVQQAVAQDVRSEQERRLLLVYDPGGISAVTDALQNESRQALADGAS